MRIPRDARPGPAGGGKRAHRARDRPVSVTPPENSAPPEASTLFDELARTGSEPTTEIPTSPRRRSRGLRRTVIIAAAVLGLLAVFYGIDVAMSSGDVPRGVTVAGVQVGGMTWSAAEQRLREQLEPRLSHPIAVQAGDVNV